MRISGLHDIEMVLRCFKCLKDSNKAGKRAERHVLSLVFLSLKKKRPRGDLIALSNFLRRGSGKGGAGLCSLITDDKSSRMA